MLLSGPANNATPLYKPDKNNFQPRASVAWSPHFKNGFLQKIFANTGDANQTSVIRGGFAMLNDEYGEQIAVSFDLNNSLGFTSNTTIAGFGFDSMNSRACRPSRAISTVNPRRDNKCSTTVAII